MESHRGRGQQPRRLGDLDVHCSTTTASRCTICETYVPNATPLFPGPKYAGPQAERFRIGDEPSPDGSVDYCSGCGICTQVCPQGVHIAEINSQARAELKERQGVKLRDRVRSLARRWPGASDARGPLANWGLRLLRVAIEKTIGIHHRAPVPRYAGRTFQRWARSTGPPPRTGAPRGLLPRLRHQLLRAASGGDDRGAARAQRRGRRGAQTGLLWAAAQSNGLFDDARGYVHRLAARLAPYARDGVDIVATSTSCSLMLKREALEILGMTDDLDLQVVSERVFDICEYLLAMHERGELRTDFRRCPRP